MRVTADSNIFISALLFGGKPLQLLDLATKGDIQLAISEAIITEVLRVLRDKFERDETALARSENIMRRVAELVTPTQSFNAIPYDEPDNRIIECAVEAKSDYIITGDLDLLRLRNFHGIRITRVADFLRKEQGQQR